MKFNVTPEKEILKGENGAKNQGVSFTFTSCIAYSFHFDVFLQWAVLNRKHADIVVKDEILFPMFQLHCKASYFLFWKPTFTVIPRPGIRILIYDTHGWSWVHNEHY